MWAYKLKGFPKQDRLDFIVLLYTWFKSINLIIERGISIKELDICVKGIPQRKNLLAIDVFIQRFLSYQAFQWILTIWACFLLKNSEFQFIRF